MSNAFDVIGKKKTEQRGGIKDKDHDTNFVTSCTL